MESADLREVFARLGQTGKPLLDERTKELVFPGYEAYEEPLCNRKGDKQ